MRHRFRSTAAFGAAALLTGGLFGPAHPAGPSTTATLGLFPSVHATFISGTAPTSAECAQATGVPCYDPAQLQTAYDEGPLFSQGLTGEGQTIVLVDPLGSPTIRSDLATFDRAFNLPNPPSLQIVQPEGPIPPYDPTNIDDVVSAEETSLDVEWAHAIAPGADIVLDEATVPATVTTSAAAITQYVDAENYVIDRHLGDVISQSFGAAEEDFGSGLLQSLRSTYAAAQQAGITVLAATGDDGATVPDNSGLLLTSPAVGWPAVDPLVTAVGGTQLSLDAAGHRTAPDQAWNDTNNVAVNQLFAHDNGPNPLATGGGLSTVFARPAYQNTVVSTVGGQRGIPDVAMSGAGSGPVLIYTSFANSFGLATGFSATAGTSESSPLFAGIVALADQWAGRPLGLINPALYQLSAENAPGLVDVTSGDNTVTFPQGGILNTVQGFNAGPGYDLVSGVGTVNAARFVPELAAAVTGSNQGDQG